MGDFRKFNNTVRDDIYLLQCRRQFKPKIRMQLKKKNTPHNQDTEGINVRSRNKFITGCFKLVALTHFLLRRTVMGADKKKKIMIYDIF